ncbi:MAG TPA: tyrosine-type recombinase/integrase [Blastocatellia bacterium]|nr:tyrosine-type recombinase/integrase [Blastocatellia bacterium]
MARDRSGMIFEREKGVWYARVTFTDQSGKRRYIKRRGDTKSHAKELVKQLLRDLDDSGDMVIEGNQITVNKYFDRWLTAAAKPRLSERTFLDYEDLLRRYIRPAMGNKRLADLRPLDVQALYSDLQERGLSSRTVRYTHAVLSSGLKQAVKWGLIIRNPASMTELPKQTRKEMQSLSPESAASFLAAAAKDKWGIIFSFALVTGMRPEEYLGLQWKDIDFQSGLVTVQRTLCWRRRGGGWYFGEPKTSSSRRSIPLPYSIIGMLAEHKRQQAEKRLKMGPVYQNFDLVFNSDNGGPLLPQNLFRRHFKPILKEAGLDQSIRMYDLRHSCATLLLASNENPKVVSERLGHASITLTLDTYSHVLPSMQRAATDKLERMLFSS